MHNDVRPQGDPSMTMTAVDVVGDYLVDGDTLDILRRIGTDDARTIASAMVAILQWSTTEYPKGDHPTPGKMFMLQVCSMVPPHILEAMAGISEDIARHLPTPQYIIDGREPGPDGRPVEDGEAHEDGIIDTLRAVFGDQAVMGIGLEGDNQAPA